MNAEDILQSLRGTFGSATSVRSRRPNLYQLSIPVFMGDGDGAQVFLRLKADGRAEVTDLGQTMTRLSYTRTDVEATRNALGALADRHGFSLSEDALTVVVQPAELLGAALGLVQIESEAEASIRAISRTRMKAARFKDLVMSVLDQAFRGAVENDYHAPEDEKGMYPVDARIHIDHSDLFVVVTPSDIEAERAVSAHLYLDEPERRAKRGASKEQWVAIPRDLEALQSRTRTRLMTHYYVPVPKYGAAPELLIPKLKGLAA